MVDVELQHCVIFQGVLGMYQNKIDKKTVLGITALVCGFNYMDWTDGLDYCINISTECGHIT